MNQSKYLLSCLHQQYHASSACKARTGDCCASAPPPPILIKELTFNISLQPCSEQWAAVTSLGKQARTFLGVWIKNPCPLRRNLLLPRLLTLIPRLPQAQFSTNSVVSHSVGETSCNIHLYAWHGSLSLSFYAVYVQTPDEELVPERLYTKVNIKVCTMCLQECTL